MHVVGWLKDYGWSAPEIAARLARDPNGIAEKYGDRLEEEVDRCWNKAETKPRQERSGRHGRSAPGADRSIDEVVTEDAAALRYAELYGGRLRFCHDTGAWFEWTGAAWRQNRSGLAFQWARELARDLSRPFGDEPKIKAVLGKTAFAAGVERFARSDPPSPSRIRPGIPTCGCWARPAAPWISAQARCASPTRRTASRS